MIEIKARIYNKHKQERLVPGNAPERSATLGVILSMGGNAAALTTIVEIPYDDYDSYQIGEEMTGKMGLP